jgi:uncharacterized protein YkwD
MGNNKVLIIRYFMTLFAGMLAMQWAVAQEDWVREHCVSEEEVYLWELVNEHRENNGLEPVVLSKSLSYVARAHVVDLEERVGSLTHAWSDCEYRAGDATTYDCMWKKPQKLTPYPGFGYECAYGTSQTASAQGALASWQRSSPHNAVILNRDVWANMKWQAVGVGIFGGYACIWFGTDADPLGTAEQCAQE